MSRIRRKLDLSSMNFQERRLLRLRLFILRFHFMKILNSFYKRIFVNRNSACGHSGGRIVVRGKRSLRHLCLPRCFLPKLKSTFTVLFPVYNSLNPEAPLSLVLGSSNIIQYHFSSHSNTFGTHVFYLNNKLRRFLELSKSKSKYEGSTVRLFDIPIGSYVCNISTIPNHGPTLARSSGCRAQLLFKKKLKSRYYAGLVMPSGKQMFVNLNCVANLGSVPAKPVSRYRTAGFAFRRGSRPVVRGVAMNPVDHPHGGGEGKKSNPAFPRTRCGRPAKFVKTLSSDHIVKKERFLYRMKYRAFSFF